MEWKGGDGGGIVGEGGGYRKRMRVRGKVVRTWFSSVDSPSSQSMRTSLRESTR